MINATVTPEAAQAIADIAQRHGLSQDAVLAMLVALRQGGGTMAQFSIPELGGSGQWMRGGMTMVGNMFDNALKARVDALCNELTQLLATVAVFPAAPAASAQPGFSSANWWPGDLGVPSSVGGQNDTRYAFFPGTRRLAIQINGLTKVFDTGEHHIGGVQQQQGSGYSSVSFTSQLGTFGVASLREVGTHQAAQPPAATPPPAAAPAPGYQSQYQSGPTPRVAPPASAPPASAPPASAPPASAPPAATPAAGASEDAAAIVTAIESLAGLHQRGILSDEEFATKKAELLARL